MSTGNVTASRCGYVLFSPMVRIFSLVLSIDFVNANTIHITEINNAQGARCCHCFVPSRIKVLSFELSCERIRPSIVKRHLFSRTCFVMRVVSFTFSDTRKKTIWNIVTYPKIERPTFNSQTNIKQIVIFNMMCVRKIQMIIFHRIQAKPLAAG